MSYTLDEQIAAISALGVLGATTYGFLTPPAGGGSGSEYRIITLQAAPTPPAPLGEGFAQVDVGTGSYPPFLQAQLVDGVIDDWDFTFRIQHGLDGFAVVIASGTFLGDGEPEATPFPLDVILKIDRPVITM